MTVKRSWPWMAERWTKRWIGIVRIRFGILQSHSNRRYFHTIEGKRMCSRGREQVASYIVVLAAAIAPLAS
jgi:hypothetical protein